MGFSKTGLSFIPISKNWGWMLFWGILLVVLGVLALVFDVFTTLMSVIFIGSLLVVGGVIIVIDAFASWWRNWGHFLLHLLIGILYIIVGWMTIQNPIMASVSLTLLLGIFYVVLGVLRIIYSYRSLVPQRGWRMLSGVISLILGILILVNWPAASLFIIGLFIGIDLIFAGWSYIMLSFMVRGLAGR